MLKRLVLVAGIAVAVVAVTSPVGVSLFSNGSVAAASKCKKCQHDKCPGNCDDCPDCQFISAVTASSYISNFVPSLAFDGVSTDSSAWQASRAPLEPEWIKCEFAGSKRITSLSLQAQGGNKNNLKRAPKDFILQGSNNDRDYEDLLKVMGDIYSEPGEWHSWRFKNYDSYKYYRIYVTKNAGALDVFLAIQEIKMR